MANFYVLFFRKIFVVVNSMHSSDFCCKFKFFFSNNSFQIWRLFDSLKRAQKTELPGSKMKKDQVFRVVTAMHKFLSLEPKSTEQVLRGSLQRFFIGSASLP